VSVCMIVFATSLHSLHSLSFTDPRLGLLPNTDYLFSEILVTRHPITVLSFAIKILVAVLTSRRFGIAVLTCRRFGLSPFDHTTTAIRRLV